MKKLILAALASTCLLTGGLNAQDDVKKEAVQAAEVPAIQLETRSEKLSYMFGYQLGMTLKDVEVELDIDLFAAAMADVKADKDSLLSQDDMQEAMMELQQELMAKQQEKQMTEANKFMAEWATKEGVQVTDSGLLYIVTKEGDGVSPTDKDTVKIHYHGSLPDGTVFDSSIESGKPIELSLQRVIAGWQEGIPLMQIGGEMKLIIPPALGYGDTPPPRSNIPPNSPLIFDVKLLDIVTPDALEAIPVM
jgi:FKBP-type peptidyl-prolyl cis-trans isomerase